jgi:hypothetical protein
MASTAGIAGGAVAGASTVTSRAPCASDGLPAAAGGASGSPPSACPADVAAAAGRLRTGRTAPATGGISARSSSTSATIAATEDSQKPAEHANNQDAIARHNRRI